MTEFLFQFKESGLPFMDAIQSGCYYNTEVYFQQIKSLTEDWVCISQNILCDVMAMALNMDCCSFSLIAWGCDWTLVAHRNGYFNVVSIVSFFWVKFFFFLISNFFGLSENSSILTSFHWEYLCDMWNIILFVLALVVVLGF